MQQPRIWLVEDEQSIADTLVYMLQQEGFQVTVFDRGLPALEAAAHQAPDVAILDVGLPDISGFELCRRLLTRFPALPVLLISGQDLRPAQNPALPEVEWLRKPFTRAQLAQALKNCRVPVVVTGQRFQDVACVYNDDRTAARELAQRMLDHGRRRIVYIGGTERDDATGVQRREGVQDALNAAGLNGEQMPRICCKAFTMEEGQRCMQELLVRCPDLDGVVCVTDTVAFGAMRALREAGRHVGQDVGLAGVGDSWAGSMMEPGLATVRFYQKQVGQEAARILLQMLEENGSSGPVRQVTLGYQIVERGSL